MTNGVTSQVVSAQLGKLKVSILDNFSAEQAGVVRTALENTRRTLPGTLDRIADTVEIAVTKNLDAPTDQAVAVISHALNPETGRPVAVFSRSLSLGHLQEMLEKLIRQAVQHFPK